MRVKNTSKLPRDECRRVLRFAARGVRDTGIEVHVKGGEHLVGVCYFGIPKMAQTATKSHTLITIRIPNRLPKTTRQGRDLKGIQKKWPSGIPLETWQDCLVFIAAHEFRHAWQGQRRARRGDRTRRKGEYDADKHAHNRLNAWRVATDRFPIPPVQQPNPFRRA